MAGSEWRRLPVVVMTTVLIPVWAWVRRLPGAPGRQGQGTTGWLTPRGERPGGGCQLGLGGRTRCEGPTVRGDAGPRGSG